MLIIYRLACQIWYSRLYRVGLIVCCQHLFTCALRTGLCWSSLSSTLMWCEMRRRREHLSLYLDQIRSCLRDPVESNGSHAGVIINPMYTTHTTAVCPEQTCSLCMCERYKQASLLGEQCRCGLLHEVCRTFLKFIFCCCIRPALHIRAMASISPTMLLAL